MHRPLALLQPNISADQIPALVIPDIDCHASTALISWKNCPNGETRVNFLIDLGILWLASAPSESVSASQGCSCSMQHNPITQHVRFVLLLLVQNMKTAERLSYEFIRGVLNADFFTRTRYKT